MDVVVFDPNEFYAMYPQFQNVYTPEQLGVFFNVACMMCDNSENSLVKNITERKTLLYLLVCHIATLQERGTGMVGTITSASEGGVSVSLQAYTNNPNWYTQTQCGSTYWLLTQKYRTGMRYVDWIPC